MEKLDFGKPEKKQVSLEGRVEIPANTKKWAGFYVDRTDHTSVRLKEIIAYLAVIGIFFVGGAIVLKECYSQRQSNSIPQKQEQEKEHQEQKQEQGPQGGEVYEIASYNRL